VITIRMDGGPKHGRTYRYPEPLPRVVVFQQKTDTGYVFIDYRRRQNTAIYDHVQPDR
jgi:hypothetical protein